MEYLDIYDENGNHIGKEERGIVHRDALWHKTIHCWLYDTNGNVFFQRRTEEKTLYTTASGHISAGETLIEAFAREIKEEIGVLVDYNKAELVDVITFVMDREKSDGSMFRDRVFANIYVCEFKDELNTFDFDPNELLGLVRVNAKEALELFKKEDGSINGTEIDVNNVITEKSIDFKEFLVNDMETATGKYGAVLEKIIDLCS